MADYTALLDIDHEFGGDVGLSATGDLATVSGNTRSAQRIYRRLLTNPGDYIWQPTYGAGLPRRVGTLTNIPEITALIRSQMALEPSVSQSPAPVINVSAIPNGVSVQIAYTSLPDRQPTALSFSVSA